MTTFDKREEGFEKQFVRDEELRFKATARRNKVLGLWAAEKLGLSGAQAEDYAKEVVLADFEEPGDQDVFRKIRKDFDAKGVNQSDHQNSAHHGRADGESDRRYQSERLVRRFRSPHHSCGGLVCGLLNQSHTRIKALLVSFDSEIRKYGLPRDDTNVGIGTLVR